MSSNLSTPPGPTSSSPPSASTNEAWNRLLSVEQALAAVQMQGNQWQQQAAAAQAAAQAAQVAAAQGNQAPLAGGNRGARPKPPPMVSFNGMMGKTGFAVDHWIREVNKQFAYYPDAFPDGATKISYAIGWLSGPALDWWESEEKAYPAANHGVPLTDWNVFVERLRDRYRPRLPAEIARQQLRSLVQKGRVEYYCNQFLSLVAHIPNRNEEDKIFDFKTGLDRRLAAKVAERQPATLQEAIEIAVQAEPYVTNDSLGRGHGGSTNLNFNRGNSSNFPRATNGSNSSEMVPMDINHLDQESSQVELEEGNKSEVGTRAGVGGSSVNSNVLSLLVTKLEAMETRLLAMSSSHRPPAAGKSSKSGSRDRVPGLSGVDIAALLKEGRCFRCREKGHMKSECPLKY